MPDGLDIEQRQREEARWRILRVVDAGRPVAVSEQIVWRVLTDIKLSLSLNQVRRELSYLQRSRACSNWRARKRHLVCQADGARCRRGRIHRQGAGRRGASAQVLVSHGRIRLNRK